MTRTETTVLPRFIVMTAAANMGSKCKGVYKRVAVVELEEGTTERPKMISDRAKGIKRIVSLADKLNVGKTEKCAFAVALRDAEQMAAKLNA